VLRGKQIKAARRECQGKWRDLLDTLKAGRLAPEWRSRQPSCNKLIESRDRIQALLEAIALTDESITDLVQLAQVVNEGLNHPTFEQKRRWLGYLKIKVIVAY